MKSILFVGFCANIKDKNQVITCIVIETNTVYLYFFQHQDRNSAHLAEEVVKSDVYPKPPPVPSRNVSQRRPLPPVPDTSSSYAPAEGTPTRRRAIPTATSKRGVSSRIPSMLPHIANKAQSQEALNVAR